MNRNIDMVKKRADLKFGREGEQKSISLFREVWGNVFKYDWGMSPMDFYKQDDDIIEPVGDKGIHLHEIELKTRRVRYATYPDYAFGYNKYEKALKNLNEYNTPTTFVFNLLDGYYYWNFDKNTKENEYRIGIICNRARNDKEHEALFIKREFLTPLTQESWKVDRNKDKDYRNTKVFFD